MLPLPALPPNRGEHGIDDCGCVLQLIRHQSGGTFERASEKLRLDRIKEHDLLRRIVRDH